MGDLGNLLRETREKRGLSLEQAEADTRIRYRFLVALENEDYDALPGQVYVKGFLKSYASYLGLEPAQVVGLYTAEESVEQPSQPARDVPLVEVPIEGPRDLRPAIVMLTVVAALMLLVAGYFRAPWRSWLGIEGAKPTPPPTSAPAPTWTTEPTTAPTSNPTAAPTATVATTPTRTRIPTATRLPGGEVNVSFVVTGRSWVQIVVDGQVAYSGLLEDETRQWAGKSSVVARIGNAGAVDITVNDEHLGVLGAQGAVIVQEWIAGEAPATPEPSATAGP